MSAKPYATHASNTDRHPGDILKTDHKKHCMPAEMAAAHKAIEDKHSEAEAEKTALLQRLAELEAESHLKEAASLAQSVAPASRKGLFY